MEKNKKQGVAEGSEWEARHDEFTTVGDRATPEQINKIINALGIAAKQAVGKRGFLNQIFGKQSNGDLARMAQVAETLAKNIQKNKNAKPGTDERKELGQHLVYAVSLLKRMNGEQGMAEGWKEKAASAALSGSLALGSPAATADIGASVANGLGRGAVAGVVGPQLHKEKNAADLAFAEKIPDETDKAEYLKAFERIKKSRTLSSTSPAGIGANAFYERRFEKLKQNLGKKHNIQMPANKGVAEGIKIAQQLIFEGRIANFRPPFRVNGNYVDDARGNSVCEMGTSREALQHIADALNAWVKQNVSESIEDNTASFISHYKDDPIGMFMHSKSSYLDAISRAKNFSMKAANLHKSHEGMNKKEFQDSIMKHFIPHLRKHGFPKHASEGWGAAEHDFIRSIS